MKPNTLTIASLLSIILLPLHIAGDVALGLDRGGSGLFFVVVPILLVVACGTLLLAARRSGHIITFLGGLAMILSARGLWNLRSRKLTHSSDE